MTHFSLYSVAIARPRATLRSTLAIVALAGLGLVGLELRTDGHSLVPTDAAVVGFDASLREDFHLRDPLVVWVERSDADDIFHLDTLRIVSRLSKELLELDGVEPGDVTSLATERRDRVYPRSFEFRPFLDPLPDTTERMVELRGDITAAGIVRGTLVSHDARAAAILVGVPPSFPDGRAMNFDRADFYDRVVEVAARHTDDAHRIAVVGAPAAEALLGRHILRDLGVLLPAAMGVIALLVLVGCGRLWAVGLALAEVAACLVFTFGLMGWTGTPVYLTTGVLPVILTTIGIADEIHIFRQYQRSLRGFTVDQHPAAVRNAMSCLVRPIVLTSLTTAVGLLSFATSSVGSVRAFGLFAAVGVVFCMLFSLTAIPAALALLPPDRMQHRFARRTGGGGDSGVGWTARALLPVVRRGRPTLRVLLGVTLLATAGVVGLRIQDSWIDGFAKDSAFRQAVDRANAGLLGVHQLVAQLSFDPAARPPPRVAGREGPLLDPEVWRAIGGFEDHLRADPRVGGVLGAYSELSTVVFLWDQQRQGERRVPDRAIDIHRALNNFDHGRGLRRRQQVVHDDLDRALVTIFFANGNYSDTAKVMDSARTYVREHMPGLGARLDFAGDVALSQAMIPAIVRTQLSSLLLALGAAWLAVCVLERSLRRAAFAILPAGAAVAWMLGSMGWLGVPLGVATSMFCAITLGIGVDYAIHLLERVRQARAAGRECPVVVALDEAGPPILLDTLAIAGGFGLLTFSQVPANAYLGALVATALCVSCVLTLVGLGALLWREDARATSGEPDAFG